MVELCQPHLRAHTYTLLRAPGEEEFNNAVNLHYEAQMNEYSLVWNYVYMSYGSGVSNLYIQRPDSSYRKVFENVKHLIPVINNSIILYSIT